MGVVIRGECNKCLRVSSSLTLDDKLCEKCVAKQNPIEKKMKITNNYRTIFCEAVGLVAETPLCVFADSLRDQVNSEALVRAILRVCGDEEEN